MWRLIFCLLSLYNWLSVRSAPCLHRHPRRLVPWPCGGAPAVWLAAGGNAVSEGHWKDLSARQFSVWEFLQLCHQYPLLLTPNDVKVSQVMKYYRSFVLTVGFHELMIAVRHWHAGGVCLSAHSRRGKDSVGAAAQPGNVDQVSPTLSETAPLIGMVTLHTPVLLLFVKRREL